LLIFAGFASAGIQPLVADAQSDREESLLFYGIALAGACTVAAFVRNALRHPEGPVDLEKDELDRYGTALLAGGPTRVFDTAIVHLVGAGVLAHDGKANIAAAGKRPANFDPIEKQIYDPVASSEHQVLPLAKLYKIRLDIASLESGLRDRGMFMSAARFSISRVVPALLLFAVAMALGGLRLFEGHQTKKPAADALLLMAVSLAAGLVFFFRASKRTLRGDAYMNAILNHFVSMGKGAVGARSNLIIATALLGTAVLRLTEFDELGEALNSHGNPTRTKGAEDPGSEGGGGSCEGGGCGGGGD
jgi:uncharacterized protein (TIGR04222 family)